MTKHATALVTGGAGFIGSHLVDRLAQRGYSVCVIDDFSNGEIRNLSSHLGKKNFKLIKGSVTHPTTLRAAMSGVNLVFHLAAIVSVARSLTEPKLVGDVNVGGTLAVLEEARRRDVKKIAFASSAAIYGDGARPPLDESCSPVPLSPYGATKVAGEAYCRAFSRSYGIETVSLRYFNVYGSRRSPGAYSGVMMQFADAVVRSRPMVIFGDGSQCRDFVNVDDVVTATMLAAEKEGTTGEAFNVGTGTKTTILQLANAFLSMTSTKKTKVVFADPRAGDIKQSWANIGRAKRILGYRPRVRLEEGLKSFMSWYVSEHGGAAEAAPGSR